ncbi:MAG: hypothetical protein ACOCRU_02485 [bacterium]
MGVNYKTKKEIILETAYNDPFLKIEDISRIANTTSSYVRTILSDANLSLMELRKNYVRKIEENKFNIEDRILLNYLERFFLNFTSEIENIGQVVINNPNDIKSIFDNIKENFNYQSYKFLLEKNIAGIASVFWNKNFFKIEQGLNYKEFIFLLNQELNFAKLKISTLDVDIDISTGRVNEFLNSSSLFPVLKIKQLLKYDGEIIALLLLYFDTRSIGFSINYNGDFKIRIKDRSL